MNEISDIIVYMSPWPVYEKVNFVALYIAGFLTPILLIFALFFRTLETQLDGFEGNAKWSSAIKDFFLWGSVLTLYFLIGNLLTDFFNTVYAALAANESVGGLGGSLTSITGKLQAYITQAEKILTKDESAWGVFSNAVGTGALAVGYFFYYITIIGVAFITIFLRLAFALGFGIVYIWGLIAIPLAITSNLRMLRGWGIFAGAILIWPIVESLIIVLLIPVFDIAVANLMTNFDSAEANKAGIYAIFSILNLVLIAAMVAAPFIASALASNSSAMTGLVMPFVGSALTATAGAGRYFLKRAGRGAEKGVMGSAGKISDGALGSAKWSGGKVMDGAKWAGDMMNKTPPSPSQSPGSGWPDLNAGTQWANSSAVYGQAPDVVPEMLGKYQTISSTTNSESVTKTSARKPIKSEKRKGTERDFFRNKNANFKRKGN